MLHVPLISLSFIILKSDCFKITQNTCKIVFSLQTESYSKQEEGRDCVFCKTFTYVCVCVSECARAHTHTHTVQPVYFCLLTLNCNYICHSVHIPYHASYPTGVQYLLLPLLVMGKSVNNKLERRKIEAAVACYEVLWAVFAWR